MKKLKLFACVLLLLTLLLASTGCGVENVQIELVDMYANYDIAGESGAYPFFGPMYDILNCAEGENMWVSDTGYKVTFERGGDTYTQYSFPYGYFYAPESVHGYDSQQPEWYVGFYVYEKTFRNGGSTNELDDFESLIKYENIDMKLLFGEDTRIIKAAVEGRNDGANDDYSMNFTVAVESDGWQSGQSIESALENMNTDATEAPLAVASYDTNGLYIKFDEDCVIHGSAFNDAKPNYIDELDPARFVRAYAYSRATELYDAPVETQMGVQFSYDVVFNGDTAIAEGETKTLIHTYTIEADQ